MDTSYLKYKSISIRMSIICVSIYIFFNCTSTLLNYCMLGLAMFLIIITAFNRKGKIKVVNNKVSLIFLIILFYSLVSFFFTSETSQGLRFIIILVFIFIYYIVMTMDSNAYLFAMLIMAICSAIHVIFTLLQIFVPEVVMTVNLVVLGGQRYYDNVQFWSWGYYAGISSQTHMNAFYISIFIGIVFSSILTQTNKKKSEKNLILYYIVLTLGIIAIVATQKRGILLANVTAIIFTMLFYLRHKRKSTITFLLISFSLFLVGWVMMEYSSLAQTLYMRFNDSSNFMSNRDIIYELVFQSFTESPILGNGVASTYSFISSGAHNVYLQLLNDYGMLGTILFLILFLALFIMTIKVYYKERDVIQRNSSRALVFSIYIQVYFLAYGFVGNPLYDNFIFFTYIIACSIPYSIKRIRNTIEPTIILIE